MWIIGYWKSGLIVTKEHWKIGYSPDSVTLVIFFYLLISSIY